LSRPHRHTWAALLTVVAVVVLTAGCGASGQTALVQAPDRGEIGLAMPTKTSPRWIADGQNMVKQFGILGYRTDLQFADNNVQAQVSQIDGMVGHGVKALIIAAIDGTALKDVLAKATSAKIPVIAYDRLILGSPDVGYYASFDNFKVGVLQAGALIGALGVPGSRGPFNIELFAGSADDNNATFFFDGAMSVLRPYFASGTLLVRSGETAFAQVATQRWDGDIAKARMSRLLAGADAAVHVDGVLSPYDGLSRGILTALKSAGYGAGTKLPVITGQDAELDSVKLIVSGEQTETVYKDTRELAKVAVQMTNALLTGGKPQVNDTTQYNNGVKTVPAFLLQPVSVDRSNYQRVLVDGGYYTAAQIAA
jgi:putative multiple sugar transport system substrate-binding protein